MMFETEVYKNCYPYTRKSLLDFDKRQMILKLLNIREKDLCFAKYEAKKNSEKIRIQLLGKIEEERAKIGEIRMHIENNEYDNIDNGYMNWLLMKYKNKLKFILCLRCFGFWLPYPY